MFYKKILNLFFIISLFTFNFCLSSLGDYGFDNFEELNSYLTETSFYLDSFLRLKENEGDKKEREYIKSVFAHELINKVLSDFFYLIKEDLSYENDWVGFEVPETVKLYIDNVENFLFERDLLDNANYCYFAHKETIEKESKFTVIGDLHGNYNAFSRIIKDLIDKKIISDQLKFFENEFLIFTGDFIDRGSHSLELLLFIFLLKILNPTNVIILKGNHENIHMAENNGFKDEVINKLNIINEFEKHVGSMVFEKICSIFNLLPEVSFLTVCQYNFMFAHGGWNNAFNIEGFLVNRNSKFTKTFYGKTGNPGFLLSPYLWNDISPFIRKRAKILYRGIKYPATYVAKRLFENRISALFCGHDHEKPKKILCNRSKLYSRVLSEKTDGFCKMKSDYEDESPIYTTISGTISYSDFNIAYKPSYTRLFVTDNSWNVEGYSLSD